MKNFVISVMVLFFCFVTTITQACVTLGPDDTYTVDESGCVDY